MEKLMDLVITTLCAFALIAVLFCMCCMCMKISDLRMRRYILDMAKRKGMKVDMDKIDPKIAPKSPLSNENCTIMVPEVGIIL